MRSHLRRLLAVSMLTLALVGCGTTGDFINKTAASGSDFIKAAVDNAGKVPEAVLSNGAKVIGDGYCPYLPGVVRSGLRGVINARPEMKGAKVAIWCPGDAPITLGP